MPQDFEKPGNSPVEIEPLLTAFYNENNLDSDRADRLWQRLEPRLKASPVQAGRVGGWFSNLQQKWNVRMKNETPLLERDDTGYEMKKVRRGNRVRSLVGGLAALALVLGLVAVFALNAGKGPSITPGAAGQPVATNTVTSDLLPTPTPVPYDSRTPFPATADPRATATPVPYTTPDGSPRPTVTSGLAPTFDPNATATPLPFDGKTTVPASGKPGPTPTPAPFQPTVTAPPGVDTTTLQIPGPDNLVVTGFAAVPAEFDYATLPAQVRATNPTINFYASQKDASTLKAGLETSLKKAGYSIVTPPNLANSSTQGGLYIFAQAQGQPDLYFNLVSIASADEIARLSKTVYFSGAPDFESLVNNYRIKGYQNLLFAFSGYNLLYVLSGGNDPGAGTPPGTPTPVK